MDEFFQNGCSHQETATLQWFDDFPLVNPSAFVKYVDLRVGGVGPKGGGSGSSRDGNANKRMMEFLGKMWKPALQTMQTAQERVHRHMISERMRRERQKQSYLALHRLLPLGTKVSIHFSFFCCIAPIGSQDKIFSGVQHLIGSLGRGFSGVCTELDRVTRQVYWCTAPDRVTRQGLSCVQHPIGS